MHENKPNGTTQIHNVRFYNLSPRGINCLAYNKQSGKIALSRMDSSIEIWDITYAPFLEKTIPLDSNDSIEGLGWSDDRLFSAGLSGQIEEWDLSNLTCKQSQHVTGNSIWCLDINRDENSLAVGTEEGYLNIFDITDGNLLYRNLYDKQDGRILCCKYDYTGDYLVTGSMDVIRIWNTKTGHAIRKMTTGRSESKKETIVWSLQVLKDFTIISGDSRGQVNVWDGKIGVQIESHQALQADVLTIAVNDNEDMLICSGVEPIIRIFALTTITKSDQITKKWVKFLQRRVHDHDVKAIVCAGVKIISGGIDGYLGISSYSKLHQKITKHGPFLQTPCTTVAQEPRLILLRYCNFLEIWKMGKSTEGNILQISNDDDKRKLLTLSENPEKILQFRSRYEETIIAATLSPNGQFLLYSTKNCIRLFTLSEDIQNNNQLKLDRIKDLPSQLTNCNRALFSFDSKKLFLVKNTNQIDIFKIVINNSNIIDYDQTIDTTKYIKDVINLIEISNCGQYFIVAGTCRTISVWKLIKKQWKHHINLPKYLVPTTAIALHSYLPRLVATFTDGKIFEYDLEEMRFICSTNNKENFSNTHCINNILLDSRNENIIILHNDTNLFVLKKINNQNDDDDDDNDNNIDIKKKKSKIIKIENQENVSKLKVTYKKTYEHFVHLSWLSKNEMIAVGVNPVSLIEELPATFKQKKFGAS